MSESYCPISGSAGALQRDLPGNTLDSIIECNRLRWLPNGDHISRWRGVAKRRPALPTAGGRRGDHGDI